MDEIREIARPLRAHGDARVANLAWELIAAIDDGRDWLPASRALVRALVDCHPWWRPTRAALSGETARRAAQNFDRRGVS